MKNPWLSLIIGMTIIERLKSYADLIDRLELLHNRRDMIVVLLRKDTFAHYYLETEKLVTCFQCF